MNLSKYLVCVLLWRKGMLKICRSPSNVLLGDVIYTRFSLMFCIVTYSWETPAVEWPGRACHIEWHWWLLLLQIFVLLDCEMLPLLFRLEVLTYKDWCSCIRMIYTMNPRQPNGKITTSPDSFHGEYRPKWPWMVDLPSITCASRKMELTKPCMNCM